jgi:hypothetical protein
MQIQFREFNPFDVWIWLEFPTVPSAAEQQYIENLLDSWFFLGKLGGFNAENLQIQEEGLEISYMHYEIDRGKNTMMALMHNMGTVEFEGLWARCWFDLGTSDALALDVLINAFQQLSREYVALTQLVVGGENADWPVPREDEPERFYEN